MGNQRNRSRVKKRRGRVRGMKQNRKGEELASIVQPIEVQEEEEVVPVKVGQKRVCDVQELAKGEKVDNQKKMCTNRVKSVGVKARMLSQQKKGRSLAFTEKSMELLEEEKGAGSVLDSARRFVCIVHQAYCVIAVLRSQLSPSGRQRGSPGRSCH